MKVYFSTNQPQFKATKIATTKNTVGKTITSIDLYKLGKEDRYFLDQLDDKIDFKTLFPKLDEYARDRWKQILRFCIARAQTPEHTTYLAVNQNKPCGILSYSEDGNSLYLDGICSIPVETNKKVNFAGITMFLQLFKDAIEYNAKSIILDAVNNGPFEVIEKYEKLGFKKDPTSYPYTKMVCNKHRIAEQIKEIPYIVNYKNVKAEKVNLNKILD